MNSQMRRYIEQQNGGGESVRAFIPVESGCPPVQYIHQPGPSLSLTVQKFYCGFTI